VSPGGWVSWGIAVGAAVVVVESPVGAAAVGAASGVGVGVAAVPQATASARINDTEERINALGLLKQLDVTPFIIPWPSKPEVVTDNPGSYDVGKPSMYDQLTYI
jgi:hypothetical protein